MIWWALFRSLDWPTHGDGAVVSHHKHLTHRIPKCDCLFRHLKGRYLLSETISLVQYEYCMALNSTPFANKVHPSQTLPSISHGTRQSKSRRFVFKNRVNGFIDDASNTGSVTAFESDELSSEESNKTSPVPGKFFSNASEFPLA